MKKLLMSKQIFKLMIALFLLGSASTVTWGQPQSIDSMRVIPENPTESDTLKLIVHSTFSTGPCTMDTFMISQQDSTIFVMFHYLVGDYTAICHSVDTLPLGLYSTGTYSVVGALTMNMLQAIFDFDTTGVTVAPTLSLRYPNSIDAGLKLFPNPGFDRLNITSNHGINNIRLFTLQGRMIMEQYEPSRNSATVDISSLPNGIYMVEVQTANGGRYMQKLVKQNL